MLPGSLDTDGDLQRRVFLAQGERLHQAQSVAGRGDAQRAPARVAGDLARCRAETRIALAAGGRAALLLPVAVLAVDQVGAGQQQVLPGVAQADSAQVVAVGRPEAVLDQAVAQEQIAARLAEGDGSGRRRRAREQKQQAGGPAAREDAEDEKHAGTSTV